MGEELSGAKVVAAGSVTDGMAKVTDDFDAAVLDIRLPDGEIYSVADALVAHATPLIFYSGNVDGAAQITGGSPQSDVRSRHLCHARCAGRNRIGLGRHRYSGASTLRP